MSTTATMAQQLDITTPVCDPSSDDANAVADALTDLLADICQTGGDWRHVLAWAYEPRAAVTPPEPRAPEALALIGCLDADAQDGEARITVVRRAVSNFRAEHLDPTGDLLDANITAEDLAAALSIPLAEAQQRVADVAVEPLNPLFWG